MASFTVEATGVQSYQWQFWNETTKKWNNNKANATSASFSFTVAETYYANKYRCKLTGEDGSVLYTDAVQIVKPGIIINEITYEPIDSQNCRVVSYSGSATSLVIPQTVEGYTVTEIGEEAFMDKTFLASIDLPDTITVIRARAFKGCTNLSEMK